MIRPKHMHLARLPTPLHYLRGLSEQSGVHLYIKRDDLTGLLTSGNKVRKLEFLVYDAASRGCRTLVTCGGAQSNHARATAAIAAQLRMGCVLLLRGSPGEAWQGNSLLDRLLGAEVRYVSDEEYRQIEKVFEEVRIELERAGRQPYIIPEGGSNALGAFGYVAMVEELKAQLESATLRFDSIVCAVGSGGTHAGLLLGTKLVGLETRVWGVPVSDTAETFRAKIMAIIAEAVATYGLDVTIAPSEVLLLDGYAGLGYGLSRPEELAVIASLAREEGIILDPVYTAKAMLGLLDQVKRDRTRFGEHVLFIHTGGLFGLFPKARELQEAVSSKGGRS